MALSYWDALEGFAEKGAGKAVFISVEDMVVPLVGWVDIALCGDRGLTAGMMMVTGLTGTGTWAKGLLVDWGVVAKSRGLLGLGSGLMSLEFQPSWKCLQEEMVTQVGESWS